MLKKELSTEEFEVQLSVEESEMVKIPHIAPAEIVHAEVETFSAAAEPEDMQALEGTGSSELTKMTIAQHTVLPDQVEEAHRVELELDVAEEIRSPAEPPTVKDKVLLPSMTRRFTLEFYESEFPEANVEIVPDIAERDHVVDSAAIATAAIQALLPSSESEEIHLIESSLADIPRETEVVEVAQTAVEDEVLTQMKPAPEPEPAAGAEISVPELPSQEIATDTFEDQLPSDAFEVVNVEREPSPEDTVVATAGISARIEASLPTTEAGDVQDLSLIHISEPTRPY